MKIEYDLENSPLQIKTNSENEKVAVWFLTDLRYPAGGVGLYFSSPPQYMLVRCKTWTKLTTDLTFETDKVWTITRSSDSGKIRVVIYCNDKEVVNVVLSDTTCSESGWSTYWSTGVKKIYFNSNDKTTSVSYRKGKFQLY